MDPWKDRILPNIELFGEPDNSAMLTSGVYADYESVRLYGVAEAVGDGTVATLKEVVVNRYPRVLQIFNILEHGRRLYRSQVFSSDVHFSLHAAMRSLSTSS